ncbi:MAG TPA: hypothetical protein VHO68_07730, partial [Bacteroidales bacterium]|nr:hypothetical protein [Bacteroidales bacterium]
EKITLKGYYDRVTAVAITPDGKYAISASYASGDRTFNVLNLENGEEKIITVRHNRDVTAVAITPDGKYAVSASGSIFDPTLEVWNLENGENVSNFIGDNSFRTCNISPDGKIIAASDYLGRMHFFHLVTPH